MKTTTISFDEHQVLHELKHFLPAQAALKDFVHHNTLHAFQNEKFHEALNKASVIFGYKTYLSLAEFRELYSKGKIREEVLNQIISEKKGTENIKVWKQKLLNTTQEHLLSGRVGQLRAEWKAKFSVNLDKVTQPILFRLLSAYLDQGVSMWSFPFAEEGFLASIRAMENEALSSIFKTKRAPRLLQENKKSLTEMLQILVGNENYFEQYLFDQQFSHPGWSGIVSVIEHQPETLLDKKAITLHDVIYFELLLEIDALDHKFGTSWEPLSSRINTYPSSLFGKVEKDEIFSCLEIWQEAYEWSYFDDVVLGIKNSTAVEEETKPSFQALFCIDDRSYSLRKYLENEDENCATFGTPGFFGVEFYFQPENGKFYTKACPAPVNPKFLIKEQGRSKGHYSKDGHYSKHTHQTIQGWLYTQTFGFWAAVKLFTNIFKPSESPAMALSFQHMDKNSKLSIESEGHTENNLQIGFTVPEMAQRVRNTLMSIGLTKNFAPLVYVIGHGASSVNNTHYAGYDCGACCGRPGAVNAKVFSFMANHPKVREVLSTEGINIPNSTLFIGGMHDTTRDEIQFYGSDVLEGQTLEMHKQNKKAFKKALLLNAKERSRRFDTINSHSAITSIHESVKKRSVSLFEPRPELNHATNALCIIGRSSLSRNLFLDRRPFMNSYDYRIDPEGKFLANILNAAAPVCGGINLEYYFSRVDQEKLGAGTKLPHNVVGLFAVSNGVEGDLRPGLPSQMIEVHDPVRIMFIIEHKPSVVLNTIQSNPATYEWFNNEWVLLMVKDPDSGKMYRFKNENFTEYLPIKKQLEPFQNIELFLDNSLDTLPVLTTNH